MDRTSSKNWDLAHKKQSLGSAPGSRSIDISSPQTYCQMSPNVSLYRLGRTSLALVVLTQVRFYERDACCSPLSFKNLFEKRIYSVNQILLSNPINSNLMETARQNKFSFYLKHEKCANVLKRIPVMFRGIILLIMSLFSCASVASVDCKMIIGKWSGEVYNYEMEYRSVFAYEYKPDGTFTARFSAQSLDGTDSNEYANDDGSIQSGTWECQDGELSMITTKVDGYRVNASDSEKVYKLELLDQTRMTYTTIVGYAPGLNYELYREH